MAADLIIPAGDFGFKVYFFVQDAASNAFDATDYTATWKYWQTNNLSTVQSKNCIAEDAAKGEFSYTVADGDFPAEQDFEFELQLTKSGAQQSTVIQTLRVEISA